MPKNSFKTIRSCFRNEDEKKSYVHDGRGFGAGRWRGGDSYGAVFGGGAGYGGRNRSEEHTSELQSLMRISYAVFCLKKQKKSQSTIAHATSTQQHTNGTTT